VYIFADKVTSDIHVTGTPDLKEHGSQFQTLTEYTQTLPKTAGLTVVMPGNKKYVEINTHIPFY
jgi:hypothetical protein